MSSSTAASRRWLTESRGIIQSHPTDAHDNGIHPLPISRACFACGTDNEIGLRARLGFDADAVRATWQPRAPFQRSDGSLAPAALTTLLDEAAFWLGVLATGESGMTTELRVSLHGPASFEAPVTVMGARAAVRTRHDDPRYQQTEIVAHAAARSSRRRTSRSSSCAARRAAWSAGCSRSTIRSACGACFRLHALTGTCSSPTERRRRTMPKTIQLILSLPSRGAFSPGSAAPWLTPRSTFSRSRRPKRPGVARFAWS